MEEPGGLHSMGSQKSDVTVCARTHTGMLYTRKEENILLNFLLLKIKVNVISSLRKVVILFCMYTLSSYPSHTQIRAQTC